MRDGEWSLVYPGTAIVFGPADLPIINLSAPNIGPAEIHTDDADRPRADGVAFGVDYLGGQTIAFDLGVFGTDEADARQQLATLTRAWRADAVRSLPGAVAELRVRYAGQERAFIGRPRRFAALDTHIRDGVATAVADFATAEAACYSVAESSLTVAIVPPAGGGLLSPLAAPLTTTATSDRSMVVTIAGELPAWPVLTVTGPITNPVIDVVGRWRIALLTTLIAGQSVTVNTRPWVRSVLTNSGGSLAGALTRASARLAAAALPPGAYEVALRGADVTGTASLQIVWRETYSTP